MDFGRMPFLFVVVEMVAQEASPGLRKTAALYAPRLEYPFDARSRWLQGRGLFVLSVRPNGTVESVEVSKSTGHAELDQCAVSAFMEWRFKPGSVAPRVKIPMEYTMAGLRPRGIDFALQVKRKEKSRPITRIRLGLNTGRNVFGNGMLIIVLITRRIFENAERLLDYEISPHPNQPMQLATMSCFTDI